MKKLLYLARHEFLKHLRRPSFLITTLLVPLLGAVITLGLSLANDSEQPPAGQPPELRNFRGAIGYVDASGVISSIPPEFPPELFRAYPDEASGRAALAADTIVALFIMPPEYLQQGGLVRYTRQIGIDAPDIELFRTLLQANLIGGDMATALLVANPLTLTTIRLDAAGAEVRDRNETNVEQNPLAFIVPYVFALLLYTAIFMSASFLLQSVTEEKESRVLEMLLLGLRPWQLLGGKVVGLGLLGLTQMLLWLASGRLLLGASMGPLELFQQDFALPWSTLALALVYFLLGYLINASIMAGIGATVTNMREGGQLTVLMVIPFVIPLWFMSAIIDQPHGTLATILGLFPLTAPIAMMIRVALTDISPVELGVSIALLTAMTPLTIWGAARLFRVSTLLAGKRLTGGEIVRALRAR